MNLRIKFRESFRPFAPSVIREDVKEYFDLDSDSPYMLIVAPVQQSIRTKRPKEKMQNQNHRESKCKTVDYTSRDSCGYVC